MCGCSYWHLRLHRRLQHHRSTPAYASPGLSLRQEYDASVICRHGHLAVGRRDKHHARGSASVCRRWTTIDCGPGGGEQAGSSSRVETTLRSRAKFADDGFLSRLGFAPGAAAHTLCCCLFFLPREPGSSIRASEEFCRESCEGNTGRRRV